MKGFQACLWALAVFTALMPGILTWFLLCSDTFPRDVCFSRLFSLQLSLARSSSERISPPSLLSKIPIHEEAADILPNQPYATKVSTHNMSFAPSIAPMRGDLLILVVSDWKSFTGVLGRAIREGWARNVLKQERYIYRVIFFVGECSGIIGGTA